MTLQARRNSYLQVIASRPPTSRISSLLGHIDEDKPKYSAIMIIEDEGVYVPVIYKECRVDLDIDNPTIHPLSGPCMEPCCYSTPELAIKAGTRIYRNMLKDNK